MRSRGQIIPKGDRRYLLRIFIGKTPDGKRKYTAKTVDGTHAQARQELTKMLRETDTGTFIEPSKQTTQEYCTEWLKSKTSLGPKTRREYEARLTKDIYPVLGALRLDALNGLRIQAAYATFTARGLSPRTIEYTHTVFSQALEAAVRFGLLMKNPAQYCELPKKDHTEQTVFTLSDASLFLEKTLGMGSKWYTLWLVLLTTGLRPAEALALQWGDIDLETGILRVQRALVEVRPGIYEPGEPKTKKSKRAIGMPAETVETLKVHRKALGAIAGFVFPNAVGSHFDLSPVRKGWKRDLKNVNAALMKAGDERRIPVVRLYDTRHTHITHLLMNNVHPQVAANRAGHSSIAVTMGTYSHVLPEVDKAAGDAIGALLFKRDKERVG